jgi:TPR repeat protein
MTNPRILLLLLLLVVIPVVRSTAQETPDSKQAELTVWARLKTMAPSDLQPLMDKAKAGDAESQCWVGRAYGDGRLVQKDEEEAARWYLKSAEQGYVPAQRLYGMGSVHINSAVGGRWMLRAAEQGDAEAEFWLGVAYEQNWFGTTQQETERWRLAESSAFRGSAQNPTRSLQDSVRLLLDIRFVGLPAVPQDLSKL